MTDGPMSNEAAMEVWNAAVAANLKTDDEPYGASAEAAAAVIAQAFAERDAKIARLREALAMAIAEMSYARGRLETIATCNEDRRIAAKLGGSCDFARQALGATDEA